MDHRRQGAIAQAVGADFEETIRNALEVLRELQVIEYFVHNEPAFVRAGRSFRPVAASGADYAGMLRGGLEFAIEVKTEAKPRFNRARVSETQQAHLDAVARGGGLALLALRLRLPDARWVHGLLPWAAIPWDRARARQGTIGLEPLAPWPLRRPILEPFLRRCRLTRAIHLLPGPGVKKWFQCQCEVAGGA